MRWFGLPALAALLSLTGCGSRPAAAPAASLSPAASPSAPSPSPSPIRVPPIPEGKYVVTATRADAVRFGLRSQDIDENTGHFTLVLRQGHWDLIQRANHPVFHPDVGGIYMGSGHRVVFEWQFPDTGTTMCRWAFHPGSKTLAIIVLRSDPDDGPGGHIAADRTIFQAHPWRKVG